MRPVAPAVLLICLVLGGPVVAAEREKGAVAFKLLDDQKSTPERYRLADHSFSFELEHKATLTACETEVYRLRFPSPVTTASEANNTVHAEFYRPQGDGPFPGVVVLDILAGDGKVARMVSTVLAQNGIAALYVYLPYYGPRRAPGSKERFLSADYKKSLEAMRQGVLDVRRAGAWLANRKDIDAQRLGIVGVSLGSFVAALTAEMEPRFQRVAIVLGGGGLVDGYYEDPRGKVLRLIWEGLGGSKKMLQDLLAPVDPLTCAANLKERQLLILAAKNDEVVPPKMAEALWKASGQQEICWYDCGHYSAILYVVPALEHVVKHFKTP
jgi:dienelactone hydrolase